MLLMFMKSIRIVLDGIWKTLKKMIYRTCELIIAQGFNIVYLKQTDQAVNIVCII